jgi:hypothetical protein
MISDYLVVYLKLLQHRSYSGMNHTASLFEGHKLCLDYLVRNLLKLYVDIEFTGSHTQVSCSARYLTLAIAIKLKL